MTGPSPAKALALEGGGTALVVASSGATVELEASRPFPPGSTLVMHLADDPRPVRIKVRGAKRRSDEGERPFRIEGRFVDLTRRQRDALLSITREDGAPAPSGAGGDGEGQRGP